VSRTLILAQQVWAGDPPTPDADALILDGERIEWAGSREAIPGKAPKRPLDLGDAVVTAAFVDPHHHFCQGVAMHGWVDLTKARSSAEVISRLRRAALSTPEGRWIVGWGYAEALIGRGHRLTRGDLDRVSSERPVLVNHRSMHSGIANSAALARVGFGRQTPRWPGGELERELRGEPNGRAWERAYGVLLTAANRAELDALGTGWTEAAHALARGLLSEGVVAIGDAGVTPRELTLLVAADLPIDVVAMPVGPRGLFATPDAALDGPKTGEDMGRVTVGPLKLFADGAERGCLRIPYPIASRVIRGLGGGEGGNPLEPLRVLRPRPAPGAIRTGTPHYPPERLRDMTEAAVSRGFQVAIHAIGNEGIRWALEALEPAGGEGNRIEHALFAEPSEADRMARAGITAVVQPQHLSEYGELVRAAGLEEYLPPAPLRRFLDAGVAMALSSDAPTAAWEPLRTMPVAVTRMTDQGHVVAPEQAITPSEALRAQTTAAARALGWTDRGALVSGQRADFVVLSGDPFEGGAEVRETWVAGSRVYPEPGDRSIG
jgi:predicted amidohydrolase YtcJ